MHTHTWKEENGKLMQTYTFTDFVSALDFVNTVGKIAEEQQHHPDICIENYNTVRISTMTHDTNSITEKDYAIAEAIDGLGVGA